MSLQCALMLTDGVVAHNATFGWDELSRDHRQPNRCRKRWRSPRPWDQDSQSTRERRRRSKSARSWASGRFACLARQGCPRGGVDAPERDLPVARVRGERGAIGIGRRARRRLGGAPRAAPQSAATRAYPTAECGRRRRRWRQSPGCGERRQGRQPRQPRGHLDATAAPLQAATRIACRSWERARSGSASWVKDQVPFHFSRLGCSGRSRSSARFRHRDDGDVSVIRAKGEPAPGGIHGRAHRPSNRVWRGLDGLPGYRARCHAHHGRVRRGRR